jgi:hypothetical protein
MPITGVGTWALLTLFFQEKSLLASFYELAILCKPWQYSCGTWKRNSRWLTGREKARPSFETTLDWSTRITHCFAIESTTYMQTLLLSPLITFSPFHLKKLQKPLKRDGTALEEDVPSPWCVLLQHPAPQQIVRMRNRGNNPQRA